MENPIEILCVLSYNPQNEYPAIIFGIAKPT